MTLPSVGEIWFIKHNKQYHYITKIKHALVYSYDMSYPNRTIHTDLSYWDTLYNKIQ